MVMGNNRRKPPNPNPNPNPNPKSDCDRALTALRRGNPSKSLRLLKDARVRHPSSPLLLRAHATVLIRLASLLEDPASKLRHLRSALDSSALALSLSPNSIELSLFHANLLFDVANDGKSYEDVVSECERGLGIDSPSDPAEDALVEEMVGSGSVADRIEKVRAELRALVQKANIASISSWMKNLGGAGGENFRLIPMHRVAEDPMEVRLVQTARRPNEIKKATKTPEERRKEIEVRVAAARLIQQHPPVKEEGESSGEGVSGSASTSAVAVSSRRKQMNVRKTSDSSERNDRVRSYWSSMSCEQKRRFLEVSVRDVRSHYASLKDGLALELLSEALVFAEANGSWKVWVCCRCHEKFVDAESHLQHVEHEHVGNLAPKLQSVLPQEVDGEWLEKIVNGVWKPIDVFAAVKILEEEQLKCQNIADNDSDGGSKDRDSLSDYWSSKDTSDSSASPDLQDSISTADDLSNGFPSERRENDISDFGLSGICRNTRIWPLSDDLEQLKLLERIQGVFQLLAKNKCLSANHLNKVIQFTMDEIRNLPSGSQLVKLAIDHSPECISFLGALQLRKIIKFLRELSHSCGLGSYVESNNSMVADVHNVSQLGEYPEKIVLDCDSSSLILDSQLFRSKHDGDDAENFVSEVDIDTDALVSWLFSGTPTGEQLLIWNRARDEKSQQGMEIFSTLEKDFYLLQNMCERKCEHLSYEEALHSVENFCVEELKRREQSSLFMAQSYDIILRKRQEELVERENDPMFSAGHFELDAISNVLKEAQQLNATQFGYDDISGVTHRLCDLECGQDDDWRMQDLLHQADTCIEVAIQKQKEHISVEISKIDAKIMRNLTGIEQLERKLGPSSAFDYCGVIVPLVKSFMRALLEKLVEKDAMEKSEAAREAFLAELAMDAKKNNNKGGDHPKQIQDKAKDKKKTKDHRKIKDSKALNGEVRFHQETTEELSIGSLGATDVDSLESKSVPSDNYLKQQEEELRRNIELEAEERKLEETLEYQRRIEDEAKKRHLEEQIKKANGVLAENTLERATVNSDATLRDSKHETDDYDEIVLLENGSAASVKGIDGSDVHLSKAVLSVTLQRTKHESTYRQEKQGILLSKGPQRVNVKHQEKQMEAHSETGATFDQNIGVSNKSEGYCTSKTNGTLIPETNPTLNVSFKSRKNGRSHTKNKQVEGFPDRNAPHDARHNQLSSNTKSTDGAPLVLTDKVNNISMQASSEFHVKEHPLKMIVENHGRIEGSDQKVGKDKRKAEPVKIEMETCSENGAKTLRELHTEDDDEERFQADLKKAVRQSLDTYEAQKNFPPATTRLLTKISPPDADMVLTAKTADNAVDEQDVFGMGLKNEVGEYNCFLNVIIQSLWHLRQFRNEFLRLSPMHMHVGNPCVVCALYEIFMALSVASTGKLKEPIAPTGLRSALSNLYPDSNFFQEAQMNDASEVLAVIFDCMHRSFTSSGDCEIGSDESNSIGSWDCKNTTCLAHSLFGMNIYEQMNCYSCGLESRHLKYTTFFHNINANALRTTKITSANSSFDELLKFVEMNHQLACDIDAGGCGKPNYIHHILSTPPHVFTTVLGWQNTCESADDISATLSAITTQLDIGVLYRGLDPGNKYLLISVVCYYGQHYHCFSYNHEHEQWFLYDDKTVKVVGGWDDVLSMCERGHLQPQVLFFEAVN